MSPNKTKLLLGLIDHLIALLDESEQIFYDERPYLRDRSIPFKITSQPERTKQNELEQAKTFKAIESIFEEIRIRAELKELDKEFSTKEAT